METTTTERPAKGQAETEATARAETATDQSETVESTDDDSQNADILKRDYLIFGIALTAISAGLTDGLYRGFGLPLWAAIPLGLTFWATAETLVYRKYKRLRNGNTDAS